MGKQVARAAKGHVKRLQPQRADQLCPEPWVQARPSRVTESTPPLGPADAISSAVTTEPPKSERVRLDSLNPQTLKAKPTQLVQHQILLNIMNVCTLEQARDLTL
jgi:hypothetical protein